MNRNHRMIIISTIIISQTIGFGSGLVSTTDVKQTSDNDIALQNYQKYLRINTTGSANLDVAVDFWKQKAEEIGLRFSLYKPAGMPIIVLTWPGANTSLPSIMLNSHMDVVPAGDVKDWRYPPFSGYMDDNRDIYGRGAQDDKDVSIQYLEAVRRLKHDNVTLQRTIHITLMPDEETGGKKGMEVFVCTDDFKALNVGFALDEGIPSTDVTLKVGYQDRRPWQMKFTVRGIGGHGGVMKDDCAADKILRLMEAITKYRNSQKKLETENLDHTTININMLIGGEVPNVVPETMSIVVDMRLDPSLTVDVANALVDSWIAEAGNGTTVEYIRHTLVSLATPVDDTNPYWHVFHQTVEDMGFKLEPILLPATSDMVPIRNLGIPALAFSPKFNTTNTVHSSNEYLNADVFLKGIDIFVNLIKNLGNMN